MGIEFINMVLLELDMVKDEEILEPPDEIKDGEEFAGEMSPEIKKLYTLWKNTGREAGILENDARWGDKNINEVWGKVIELKAKAQAINMILWVAIQDDLHLWTDKSGLAIRKGFKIVKTPVQPTTFFMGGPPNA
jgi:hypothetical protein